MVVSWPVTPGWDAVGSRQGAAGRRRRQSSSQGRRRPGLSLQGSLTHADSRTVANSGFVAVPGDTIGKWQPRVPRWRATALAVWQATPQLSASLGARYSGPQFSTLDNSDPNGLAYQGASKYFTTDLRLRWQFDRQWQVAVGVDNLNNDQYWNFHPYPQRTWTAELKFNL